MASQDRAVSQAIDHPARPHCSALGTATAGFLLSLSLVPVMTRTEAVVPTRSSTSSGTLSR